MQLQQCHPTFTSQSKYELDHISCCMQDGTKCDWFRIMCSNSVLLCLSVIGTVTMYNCFTLHSVQNRNKLKAPWMHVWMGIYYIHVVLLTGLWSIDRGCIVHGESDLTVLAMNKQVTVFRMWWCAVGSDPCSDWRRPSKLWQTMSTKWEAWRCGQMVLVLKTRSSACPLLGAVKNCMQGTQSPKYACTYIGCERWFWVWGW